jgi:8-oxo-dGTP diphosphatase
MSSDEIRAAGGVVMSDDGRVAVVHRPRYDDWTLPKGKLEPDETFEEAALREVWEETGLHARTVRELPSTEYPVRGRPKRVRYWLMSVESDDDFSPNDEVDQLRWLSPADAAALLTYDRDKEVLSAAVG